MTTQKGRCRRLVGLATLTTFIVCSAPSSEVSASSNYASGGTCIFDGTSYTSTKYRNTSGKIADLGTVGFDNKASSVADSTSSTAYQGVTFYAAYSRSSGSGSWFLARGAQVASGAGSWNNVISSFRLILTNGSPVSCT
jgi:hypothetical protein